MTRTRTLLGSAGRWLLGGSLFFLLGWVPGCTSSCETLARRMCSELSGEAQPLCSIVEHETQRSEVTSRRCQALVAAWKKSGLAQTRRVRRDYLALRRRISNMKFKEGRRRLFQEHKRFRTFFRKLLRSSWKPPAPRTRGKQSKRASRRK